MATACFTGLPALISRLTFFWNAFLLVLLINGIVLFTFVRLTACGLAGDQTWPTHGLFSTRIQLLGGAL